MTHPFCASLANRRGLTPINFRDQAQGSFDKKAIGTIIMERVAILLLGTFISLLLSRLPLLSSIEVNDDIRIRVRITDIWFVPV